MSIYRGRAVKMVLAVTAFGFAHQKHERQMEIDDTLMEKKISGIRLNAGSIPNLTVTMTNLPPSGCYYSPPQ